MCSRMPEIYHDHGVHGDLQCRSTRSTICFFSSQLFEINARDRRETTKKKTTWPNQACRVGAAAWKKILLVHQHHWSHIMDITRWHHRSHITAITKWHQTTNLTDTVSTYTAQPLKSWTRKGKLTYLAKQRVACLRVRAVFIRRLQHFILISPHDDIVSWSLKKKKDKSRSIMKTAELWLILNKTKKVMQCVEW